MAAGSFDTASIAVDAPSTIGSFPCTITVSDAAATNSPQSAAVTYTVSAGSCPAGAVGLSSSSIIVGQTATASAPAGFSGGTFLTSNSGIASISGSTITGQSPGVAGISGAGWNYPANGSTNCALAATNLTVNPVPRPTISLSPTTFSFSGISGGPTPASQTLTISNTGSATLNYTASTNQNWCRIDGVNNSGSIGPISVAAGSFDTATVSVDAPSTIGSYSCTITVSDTNATNSPQSAAVTYNVSVGDPSNVIASNASCGSISLSWTAGAGAGAYDIFRNTTNNRGSSTQIASNVAATSYQDATVVAGTNYFYWVRSVGGSGSRVAANTNSSGGIATGVCAPAAPSGLSFTNPCGTAIDLTWNDVANETGYHIWRDVSPGGSPPTQIFYGRPYYQLSPANLANDIDFTDNPATGASYRYVVTAFNTAGDSLPSNETMSIFNEACSANLTLSNKSIELVNGQAYTGQTLSSGDVLTFRLIINNSGNTTAYDVYVADTLTSTLDYEEASATFNSGTLSESVSGQIVTWNLNPNDKDTSGSNWIITYRARLTSASAQAIDFFDNTPVINYEDPAGTSRTYTPSFPLTPFRTGQGRVPTIREVAP